MARVTLEQVTKRWGEVVAVEPTDLDIADGEFVAILGPSGCGKSTTLFMLAGIYAPSGGSIRFGGAVVNEVEAKDRNVGIVFQSYALYPHMTALDNIMFPLKFKGLSRNEARERALRVARLVQVEELMARKPGEMSGGQQQRVALARALVKEPQLLLLDEPLSNLDAGLRLAMRTEIRRIQRQLRVTTLLVTHDQIEATTMADRVVCMSKGRIEQIGTPADLYHRPASLFVATFLGSPPINQLGATVSNGSVRVADRDLRLSGPAPAEIVIGVRPEAIALGQGQFTGEVEDVEPHGRETLYLIGTALGQLRAVEPGAVPRFKMGERIELGLGDALLFDAKSTRRLADTRLDLGS